MTTYQDFLSSKITKVQPSGFEPTSLPEWLFDYQAYIVNLALAKGRFAIFANTGLGKTSMQLAWADAVYRHTNRPVLIVAPLAVAKQTATDEAEKFGVPVQYCNSQDDVINGINITNYEKLSKFDCDTFIGVVLDECFTPDTLIDCLDEQDNLFQKRIDEIEVGDKILNASGIDIVSDVHRRKVDYAIKVTINGKSIICSPNHPFFTQYGWVGAQDLTPDHQVMATTKAMRMVREGVHGEVCSSGKDSILRSVLLSEMADESTGTFGESSHQGSGGETWQETIRVLEKWDSRSYCTVGTNQKFESNVKCRNSAKSLPKIEEHEAQTFRAWGQWAGIDSPTKDNEGCTWRPVGNGVCLVTGETKSGLSNLLQARLSESRSKNSYRSGWSESSFSQETGYEKGCNAGFSRVESIEVLEQGHPGLEKYRDEDGSLYFYDLGATRHPSFSIYGNLVHNSSILKSFTGSIRNQLIEYFQDTPYKLACSATPSPNDHMELGNHAEFMGIMSRTEMLAQYFVHDSGDTSKWRLKKHAGNPFWKWLAEWSVMIQKPSDLGFSDAGHELPPLNEEYLYITTDIKREGELFALTATGLTEQRQIKKLTMDERCNAIADLVNNSDEQWLVWCETNAESALLTQLIPDATEVKGSDKDSHKENSAHNFAHGNIRVLISKASIFGFGLNFQSCHNIAFASLSNSFEMTYQAIRRCYRFGQKHPVNVYYAVTDTCDSIKRNIERKQKQFREMFTELVQHMGNQTMTATMAQKNEYKADIANGSNYSLHLGDCVEIVNGLDDNSIDFSVFSPPFSSLYCYSNSERDMGNAANDDEFFKHFDYLISELFRVIKPGRLVSFHCFDIPLMKERDGFIGIRDFRGHLIAAFERHGFILHSQVCIWKNPVVAMQRTKALGLLHKQVKKDSSMSRQGIPDYLVTMRKPGDNEEPIAGKFEDYFGTDTFTADSDEHKSIEIWQRYASPVWMDIDQSDVLQYRNARHEDDERHICLAKGSLVLTYERGYVPIEDLIVGENVLTHKGRWMPIIAHAKTSDSAEAVAIRATGVHDLTVTPTHKLWTRYVGDVVNNFKSKAKRTEPDWVEAQNLTNSYINQKLPPEETSELTEKEWWIVGRWIADGHIDQRNVAHISCGNHKIEYLLDKLGDIAGNPQQHESCAQFPLKDKDYRIRAMLEKCGKGAANKQIPPEAYRLPVNLSKALLDGYLSGDGYLNEERQRWMVSSVSKKLLLGLQFLIQRVYGVTATIHAGRGERQTTIEGRLVNCQQEWNLSFQTHGYQFSFVDDQGAWKKVKSIEPVGKVETWNIEVAEDHSYTAEGCIVKNCPLQLTVIRRAMQLWSNPGDLVLSPFCGIGSEGYVALDMGRRFIGAELKESYYEVAKKNLEYIENKPKQGSLFDVA